MYPPIPHSEAPSPTSNPDNRAKESVLYKTGWGQGSSQSRDVSAERPGQPQAEPLPAPAAQSLSVFSQTLVWTGPQSAVDRETLCFLPQCGSDSFG